MKRIAILHEDLEWVEKEFKRLFERKNVQVDLIDIRDLSFPPDKKLLGYSLVLNRVYASVANRNYENVKKAIKTVDWLEANGVTVVNSSNASKADYSKYWASKFLEKRGILTPKTYLVDAKAEIGSVTAKLGFPVVIKQDCGGRAYNLAIALNLQQAKKEIERRLNDASYSGGTIVQEFVKSVNDYDIKVCVVGGENVASAYKRTLIRYSRGKLKWAGARSKGSEIIPFDYLPEKVLNIAFKASKALKADINDMDIVEGKKGLYIIENNLTPGLNRKKEETKVYKKPEKIAEYVYQKYLR